MYSTASLYGYEDHIYNQMNNIDNFYKNIPFQFNASNPQMVVENSKEFSLYNRKMEKVLKLADNLLSEVNTEIKEMATVVKKLSNNPSKLKYEMEARNAKHNLMSKKLDILKMMTDTETKIKKSMDDDLKLKKDLEGTGIQINNNGTNVSSADTFMNNFMSTNSGNTTFGILPINNQPLIELDNYEDNNLATNNVIDLSRKKEEVPVSPKDIDKPIELEIEMPIIDTSKSSEEVEPTNHGNAKGYVVNALGNRIPIYDSYEGDYLDGTMSDGKRSAQMIAIKNNPDIQEFFKYNKDEKKGYMVFYDTKTKKEVEGTHLPLKLLYPFSVDLRNNLVSTNLEYDYPIMYTKDPIPEAIAKEWDELKFIHEKREIELQNKRNNIEENEDEEDSDEEFDPDEFLDEEEDD